MTIAQLGLAGWPVAVTLAAATARERVRRLRHRGALNRALHELRRPLQTLVLSSGPDRGPGAHALRVALTALDDLLGTLALTRARALRLIQAENFARGVRLIAH